MSDIAQTELWNPFFGNEEFRAVQFYLEFNSFFQKIKYKKYSIFSELKGQSPTQKSNNSISIKIFCQKLTSKTQTKLTGINVIVTGKFLIEKYIKTIKGQSPKKVCQNNITGNT